MKVERIDLLVVGLPVAAFKAKKRAALERLVLSRHDVGRGKTVQVERARVVPQPQGALMHYGHVHDRVAEVRKERSLIIDPGSMKNYDIDKYLAEINVAVDAVGGSVNLVGLCQGGWMSAMYAARFPASCKAWCWRAHRSIPTPGTVGSGRWRRSAGGYRGKGRREGTSAGRSHRFVHGSPYAHRRLAEDRSLDPR